MNIPKLIYFSLAELNFVHFHRIPYETMLIVVNLHCAANGQYIFHINSIESNLKKASSKSPSSSTNVRSKGKSAAKAPSDELLATKRFELNWNIYKGNATDDFKIRSSV